MEKHDTILVTGGAGLVGSHVCQQLKDDGFSEYIAPGRHTLDLRNGDACKTYFAHTKPRHVIHCAARVYGIMGNMRNQGLSFYENNLINMNVIEAARVAGVERVTAMGTGCVYPHDAPTPLDEADIFKGLPHKSEYGYAQAKRAMLAMLETYRESYGMDYAYIVSCNLFGPGDKFDVENGHVIPALIRKFAEAKRSGGDVVIWGDGSARRDFLYVKDAARFVTTVANSKFVGPINMGSGSVWSIKEIVRVLTKISGLPPERIVWDSSKPNGQDFREYDLRDLTALGFAKEWSIARGLQETWEWYNEHTRRRMAS